MLLPLRRLSCTSSQLGSRMSLWPARSGKDLLCLSPSLIQCEYIQCRPDAESNGRRLRMLESIVTPFVNELVDVAREHVQVSGGYDGPVMFVQELVEPPQGENR